MIGAKILQGEHIFFRATSEIIAPPDQNPYMPLQQGITNSSRREFNSYTGYIRRHAQSGASPGVGQRVIDPLLLKKGGIKRVF